jgi:hypothetical protein
MSSTVRLETDAFSRGQITSKIWAAEELEKVVKANNLTPLSIYLLGGWYALLFFILKSRNNIEIGRCRSFDLNPSACTAANFINETWIADDWLFRSQPQDINALAYDDAICNCVINTSTEHMDRNIWWENIPAGMLCLLQSNDLAIDDHINKVDSLEEFKLKYTFSKILFEGETLVDGYHRYMLIGFK